MTAPVSSNRVGLARSGTADCFAGARGPCNEPIMLDGAGPVSVAGPTTADAKPSVLITKPSELMVARLQHYVAQVEGALAPNTVRAFRADMRVFTIWADAQGVTGNPVTLPATADQVVRFIDAMSADRAPATIRHYVSSIATFHTAAGVANPCTTPDVLLAMKRMHRRRGRAQKQAAGLGRKHITRILAATPRNTLIGLRDRALLAVAYDTLARRSELVAMDLDDLQLDSDGSGTILIRRSKSDQEGQGSERYIRPETVDHLQAWIRATRLETHLLPQRDEAGEVIRDRSGAPLYCRPLFRSVRNKIVGVAIDPKDVARRFKATAEGAGLPAALVASISAHSTRVGAAQDMVRAGLALPAVMQSGGWRSPEMVGRYTRRLEARRGGAAQLADLQRGKSKAKRAISEE